MQAVHLRQVLLPLPSLRRDRQRLRENADHWVERGFDDPVDSPVAWRVKELTSRRERARLARSVRGVLKDLSVRWLPGASPLNRVALRPYASLLAALADRLANLEYPVRAPGVLAVRRLLTDPDGPLYARPGDTPDTEIEVGAALREVLRKLDV